MCRFASRIIWMPFAWIAITWCIFLTGSRTLNMYTDLTHLRVLLLHAHDNRKAAYHDARQLKRDRSEWESLIMRENSQHHDLIDSRYGDAG